MRDAIEYLTALQIAIAGVSTANIYFGGSRQIDSIWRLLIQTYKKSQIVC